MDEPERTENIQVLSAKPGKNPAHRACCRLRQACAQRMGVRKNMVPAGPYRRCHSYAREEAGAKSAVFWIF